MNKFVVDTNVIMRDPYFAQKLDGEIIIPTAVLEELDNHKTDKGEVGKNVRTFGRLFMADVDYDVYTVFDSDYFEGKNDKKIVKSAKELDAVLVTNDYLMSAIANSVDVKTQQYSVEERDEDKDYQGVAVFDTNYEMDDYEFSPNEYVLPKRSRLQKFDGEELVPVKKDFKVWGIGHKNLEQKCALDALMDDSVKLVTLSGKAGTGKTLLAIAAGLEKTINESEYSKILISRPVVAMGDGIGYLPGDVNEKLAPWMQPIFDNIDYLFDSTGENSKSDNWKELEETGLLKIEALAFIRGRSIPRQFMIVDEAQNLTPHEVKTIITRVGEGTKIIFTGDPQQIDNPKCDSINNGLSYIVSKFKDQKIAAHVKLVKGERSELADIAAEIM